MELLMGDLGGRRDEDNTISLSVSAARANPAATLFDAALPYLRDIDPQRLRAIKTAFDRLGLLQREGVAVAMPEILIRD